MTGVRVAILGAAALFSLGSSTGWKGRKPDPPPPAYAQEDARAWCHGLSAGQTQSSLCFPGKSRCEQERDAAARSGIDASACEPAAAPIACFQLRGDPSPSMAMCARNVEDCELWRLIEHDKHGPAPGQAPCAVAPSYGP